MVAKCTFGEDRVSDEPVPDYQCCAKGAGHVEDQLRGAPPFRRAFQLLVALAHVFGCMVRVFHQLVDMRGLDSQVVRQGGLQL